MSPRELALDVRVTPVPHVSMPPNCEVLGRVYVGDLTYGLARDPKNRGLYLLAVDGYWYLDIQQLIATFGTALRAWNLEERFTGGVSITGPIERIEGPTLSARDHQANAALAKMSRHTTTRTERREARRRRAAVVHEKLQTPTRRSRV